MYCPYTSANKYNRNLEIIDGDNKGTVSSSCKCKDFG